MNLRASMWLRLLLLSLVSTMPVFAGVNLKNGNFYISYNDLILPSSGGSLEIVRTYNSKAYDVGWFGFGWGSDFETYLVAVSDGSVVIHENGTGALTVFQPEQSDSARFDDAIEKLVAVARRCGVAESPQEVRNFRERMRKNAELRLAYHRRFTKSGWLDPIHLPLGTVLFSSVRGRQVLRRIPEGYVRTFQSGRTERFNLAGKLTRTNYQSNNSRAFIAISYNSAGHVAELSDSNGNRVWFTTNADGLVTKLVDPHGKTVEYGYNGQDLARSRDVAGNVFRYQYDSFHNLRQISYTDGSAFKIDYNERQFVKKITYRNGDVLTYDYGSDPENSTHHYWTVVTNTGFNGKTKENRYEYWIESNETGGNFTKRILTDINGLTTDTHYNEKSLPTLIKRGKHETRFEYNDKGLLTRKKSTSGDFVELKYHPLHWKISEVVNKKGATRFKYNQNGKLLHAENDAGKSVDLTYDSAGNISKMESNERTLRFTYNDIGKPARIELEGVGHIDVEYDNYGEIKNTESPEGSKIGLEVARAFQELQALIKPAGVNLNM